MVEAAKPTQDGSGHPGVLVPDRGLRLVAPVDGLIAPRRAPLDRTKGEHIDGLGDNYKIVPLRKWADTPIYAEACTHARRIFRKALVADPRFDESTVLVQEYPDEDKIAFVFAHWGRKYFQRNFAWMYWTAVVTLTPALKAHLVLTGRWKHKETVQ